LPCRKNFLLATRSISYCKEKYSSVKKKMLAVKDKCFVSILKKQQKKLFLASDNISVGDNY